MKFYQFPDLGKNMRRLFIFLSILFLSLIVISHPSETYAANSCSAKITAIRKDNGYEILPPFPAGNIKEIKFFIQTTTVENFRVEVYYRKSLLDYVSLKQGDAVEFNNTNTFGFTLARDDLLGLYTSPGTYKIKVKVNREQGWEGYGDDDSCDNITYTVNPAPSPTPAPENCKITVKLASEPDKQQNYSFTSATPITISTDQPVDTTSFDMNFVIERIEGIKSTQENKWTIPGTKSVSRRLWNDGRYKVSYKAQYLCEYCDTTPPPIFCTTEFSICDTGCGQITPTPTPDIRFCYPDGDKELETNNVCDGKYAACPWCPKIAKPSIEIPNLKPLCDQLTTENNFRGKCWDCQNTGGIWSAIGCLPTDFTVLLKNYVFKIGVGAAGGMAFIYFLYGAFIILTSSGNAEKMEEAKQIITSALAGLILIIFSVFLLRVIGIDILQIPGIT